MNFITGELLNIFKKGCTYDIWDSIFKPKIKFKC